MAGRQTVFNAITSSVTTELHLFNGLEPSAAAGAIMLEVLGGSSANFTLDIQGKVHEDGTYTNIDYVQIYQAGAVSLSNSQLTVSDQTVRFYLIPIPPPLVRLVSAYTAGSLTIHASFVHLPFSPKYSSLDPIHPNYFNAKTSITTTDADTAVVPAGGAGLKTFITDIVIETANAGAFTLTNDAGVAIFGPINIGAASPFIAHFSTPLVNDSANDQVELDKTAATDDWEIYIAGYYAP